MRSFLYLLFAPIAQSVAVGRPKTSRSTSDLDWKPCDLDFPPSVQQKVQEPSDCATIDVPLDYTDEASERLQIQLIKVNATMQPPKGRVVFAPGGPGNSGVEEVAKFGHVYRDVLGDEYDIVGFDPRGVGRTIPFACTADSANITKRDYQVVDVPTDMPMIDAWSILENKAWHEASAFTERCYQAQKETGRFVSTAYVARDLLVIAEAINEDGLLRLWGRSYGTIVGQTFAAMFPDKVERLVLDSVVLASDYYAGTWHTSTKDTDNSIAHFFQECIEAGPELCPLANFTGPDTTPSKLMQALVDILEEVKDENVTLSEDYPAPSFFHSGEGLPLLGELKFGFLVLAYRPDQYPALFATINSTLYRDFKAITELTIEDQQKLAATNETPWSLGTDAFHGVACLDSNRRVANVEDMYNMVQAGVTGGGASADRFPYQLWPCAQWKFDAAERYGGGFQDIKTKHPVLFVNSPYDPITPLSGAYDAASGFPGSRLLVHEGHGHGLANHPSLCTLRTVGKYFSDGSLPSVGARCAPTKSGWDLVAEAAAFDGQANVTEDVQDQRERKMLESVYGMVLSGFAVPEEAELI